MKSNRNTKIILAVLLSIATVISVYSISAHYVASYVHEYEGALVWPTPGYSFLPWPTIPTGLMIQVIWPLNKADIQYYRYVIQSGLLVVLAALSWIAVFWQTLQLKKLSPPLRIVHNHNL
jgi:hypothetical protein